MTNQEPHIHDYTSLRLIKVIADNPNYSIADFGAKAILVRKCECGAEQAFEYGERKAMEELLKKLENL